MLEQLKPYHRPHTPHFILISPFCSPALPVLVGNSVCRLITMPFDWRLTAMLRLSFGTYFQIQCDDSAVFRSFICDWAMRAKTKWRRVWNYFVLRATTIWRSRHLHPRSALTLYPCLLPHRQPEGLEKRYVHTMDFFSFLPKLNWCNKLIIWVNGNEAVSWFLPSLKLACNYPQWTIKWCALCSLKSWGAQCHVQLGMKLFRFI